MEIELSIIIPYFKQINQIQRTITSVLNQTYTNYELLIINDDSPDWKLVLPIIQSFKDQRIKTISHNENKNGSAARNTGIKFSKGNYIAFLDADDEWLPNHLELSLNFIKSKGFELTYCKSIVKSDALKDVTLPLENIGRISIPEYLFIKNGFIPTPSIIYNKKKVSTLFDERLIRHQDYDFLLQVEAAGHKIGMSPHIGAIIHWENNNPAAKGGTWDYSLKWARNNKALLGTKAFANFLHKHCITPLLVEKKRTKALNLFFTNALFLYLPLKQWAFFISYLIWGRVVFSRIKK